MALKGINPIEQHAEKVFAGVFAVALLGVLAWQFLSRPNTVKVGKDEVSIPEAYGKVQDEAKRTDNAIRLTEPPGLPANGDEAVKQLAQFEARYQGPVAPSKLLAAALDRGGLGVKVGDSSGVASTPLAQLAVPAPSKPIAATFLATIDSIELQRAPEVAAVLPAKDPLDKAAVTIEATFDGAALKAALMDDPDGSGPIRAIPKNWWESGTQILGVLVERQMLQPNGSWSEPKFVPPMPGRISLVSELPKISTATQLKDAVRVATDSAAAIRRPDYYAVRFGEQWIPPSERESRELQEAAQGDILTLTRATHTGQLKRLKQLEDTLAKVGAPSGNTPPAQGVGGGGPGGGKSGGGGGHGGPPTAPPTPGATDPKVKQEELRKRQIMAEINKLKAEIAKTEEKLRALGDKVGDPNSPAAAPAPGQPKSASDAALLDNSAVRVWVHDVFAERGKTYRYRIILALTNPYFGHAPAMLADQAEWAKSPVIRSPASEWTDDITVDPENYLFFTSASSDDTLGRADSATAQVFIFRWGFWRRASVNLEPGDSIQAEVRVPDLSKFVTHAAAPGDAPPAGDPPGGPGGRGGGGSKAGGGGFAPSAPAPAPSPTDTANPTGSQVPMLTEQISDPTIMLGVGSTPIVADDPGKSRIVQKVFVRTQDGTVEQRIPDMEKADAAFHRVTRSAEAATKAKPADRPAGTRPPGDRDIPPPDSGIPLPGGRGG